MKVFKINNEIIATEVRVVKKDGEHIGIYELKDALAMARENKLDLVEIAPKAKPPVCRMMQYEKYLLGIGLGTMCPVHHVEMVEEEFQKPRIKHISFSKKNLDYFFLPKKKLFPYSNNDFMRIILSGRPGTKPQTKIIHYCPKCREAEIQWMNNFNSNKEEL